MARATTPGCPIALVAAGAVESETAAFSVKVPGSFETASDINNLPVKVNGDRVIRLGDVTEIRRTFEDAEGEARAHAGGIGVHRHEQKFSQL